jgi:hypothetical protein
MPDVRVGRNATACRRADAMLHRIKPVLTTSIVQS